MGRSGTGLGMAVVLGTVQDHQGYINVEVLASLPAHAGATDEGRIVYISGSKELYFGKDNRWSLILISGNTLGGAADTPSTLGQIIMYSGNVFCRQY